MLSPRLLALLAVVVASGARIPQNRPQPVEVEMRNVDLRVAPDVVLQIRRMRGQMIALEENVPVTFDDKRSFVTRIESGEIAVSADTLANLMNHYVFSYDGAPLKHLSITTTGDRIDLRGTMHKGVDLPFHLQGALSATPEGQIRVHAEKVTSGHIPMKGLLHLFGEDLAKLINLKEAQGVRMEGDDIILFPERIIPPPRIQGRVSAVRVEGNNIVQVFGAAHAAHDLALPWKARNYIYYRGSVLRFGKLTMHDADMQIVDLNPRDPFDFNLEKYNAQLVAGYSKNTPRLGLVVFMPDYHALDRERR